MTPAPDTGRTAEAMRDDLAGELADVILEGGAMSPKALADRLMAGPLAQLQADLIAARKERDEAREELGQSRLRQRAIDYVWEQPTNDLHEAIEKGLRVEAAEAEAAQLRSRLLQAEMGGEISGRGPGGSGYSGSAPSPMVSASGEYPSRSQMRMIKRLTKAYRRNDWPTMSEAGKHFALNRMADALRKVGFGLVALGIEAAMPPEPKGPAEGESPARRAMPDPLNPNQEAGDDL